MLFSCLSLNVFAADSAAGATTEASTPMTKEELRALCQSYGIGLDGKINLTKTELAKLESQMKSLLINVEAVKGEEKIFGMDTYENTVREVLFIDVGGDSGKKFNSDDTDNIINDIQLYVLEDIELCQENGDYFYRWANKIYWDAKCTLPCDFSYTVKEDGTKAFNDAKLQKYVVDGKSKLVFQPLGYSTSFASNEPFSPEILTKLTISTTTIDNIITPVGEGKPSIWNGYVTNSYVAKSVTYKVDEKDVSFSTDFDKLKEADFLGASYAVTFDIRHRDGIKTGNLLSEMRSVITKEYLNKEANEKTYVSANLPISIEADGTLVINSVKSEYKLTAEQWYQLTVYHTPRGMDGIKGTSDDNTFHVFLDGVPIATNLSVAFTKGQNSSLDNANFEYNGEKVNIYTDFLLYYLRFGQGAKAGIDVDDFRVYYGTLLECKHSWEYSHKHDLDGVPAILTAHCLWCGKTEIATEAETKLSKEEIASKVAPDNIVINTEFGEDTKGNAGSNWTNFASSDCIKLTKYDKINFKLIEVKKDGDNYYLKWNSDIIAAKPTTGADFTDFTMTDGVYNDTVLAGLVKDGTVEVKEVNGEKKVYWKSTSISGEYIQFGSIRSYNSNSYQENQEKFGAAYAFTFDFTFDGTNAISSMFENYRSYTGVNYDKITAAINFKVDLDGSLSFKDGVDSKYKDTGYDFEFGVPTQLTIYHTPRGIDGEKELDANGNCAGDDNKYHVFINGVHLASYQAAGDSDATNLTNKAKIDGVEKDIQMNPASDFVLYGIRFGQSRKGFAVDNMRLYFDNFKECAHINAKGETNAKDGKCQYCGEELGTYCNVCEENITCSAHVISTDVAIVNRSLSLTESIDMNLYLALSDAITENADARIVLDGADGARHAEFALADLTPEADGTYKVTLPLRSIDMTSRVTAAVYAGGKKLSATYTTTVADYLAEAYADKDTNENEKALIVATANYGAYAQRYFAGKNGHPTTLDGALPNTFEGCTDTVATAEPVAKTEPVFKESAGINFEEFTLVLTSNVKMRIYFTLGNGYTTDCATDADGKYYVTTDGILPTQLDSKIEISIKATDASGKESVATATISVYNCLVEIVNEYEAAEASYKNLAKAIYLYGEAVKNLTPAQ